MNLSTQCFCGQDEGQLQSLVADVHDVRRQLQYWHHLSQWLKAAGHDAIPCPTVTRICDTWSDGLSNEAIVGCCFFLLLILGRVSSAMFSAIYSSGTAFKRHFYYALCG